MLLDGPQLQAGSSGSDLGTPIASVSLYQRRSGLVFWMPTAEYQLACAGVVEILKFEFRRGLPLGRRRTTSRKRSNGHLPHRTSYLDTRSEPQTIYHPQVCSRCIYLRTCSGYTFGKVPCMPQQGIGAIQTRGFLGVWCTQGHVRVVGHRGVRFPMAFIVCMRRSRKH